MMRSADPAAPACRPDAFLTDDRAIAACVLWRCGLFDTKDIADLLGCREDAVSRTLHMAREGARQDARA